MTGAVAVAAEDAYRRLRAGEPAAVAGSCALLWVEGPDAATFLQGLVTNDVGALATGQACRALLLDAKGRVRVDMWVHRDDAEAFTLVVAPEDAEAAAAALERYHFSERLDLLGPEPSDRLTVTGADGGLEEIADIVLPGPIPGSCDLVVGDAGAVADALGLPRDPAEALEWARIALGVPRVGVDTGPTTLVQEAGLEGVAVSFTKGCYLGQETVARAQHRGRVNRALRGLRLPAPVAPGAAVRAGEREVGRVTSAAEVPGLGPVALSILRREVGPGDEVEIEGLGAPARVDALPFEGGR